MRVNAQQRAARKGKMHLIKAAAEQHRMDAESTLREHDAKAATNDALKTPEQLLREEHEAEIALRQELAEAEREAAADHYQQATELSRYVEALRHSVAERLDARGIELPSLCSCGGGFWDTRPESCANNCRFYRNHKVLAQSLTEMLHMYRLK